MQDPIQPIKTDLPRPRSAENHPKHKQPFDHWLWFEDYLKAIIGIAILGSQITFTLIVSDIADPMKLNPSKPDAQTSSIFNREHVRLCIALSWLFFTVTLGLGVISHLLVTGHRRGTLPPYTENIFYMAMTFLLNFLPIGAFLLLSLATAAYVPAVGWVGVAFTSLFALFVLYIWVFVW